MSSDRESKGMTQWHWFAVYAIGILMLGAMRACSSGGGSGGYNDSYRDAPTGQSRGGDTW
ncbi:hypothetical protein SAMN05421753_104142 [Planctomicrobium piriforme]|uniref:Uncharacterized protein n=1 Tax=Planctomicrobium piriforme TaxID=1576369 RepID=A0A1I3EAK0_9PLAN|nr:hypothetical protein SAMN05421753_104142 [Planctomicrobium piriforme]